MKKTSLTGLIFVVTTSISFAFFHPSIPDSISLTKDANEVKASDMDSIPSDREIQQRSPKDKKENKLSEKFKNLTSLETEGDFTVVQQNKNRIFASQLTEKWIGYSLLQEESQEYPDGQFFNLKSEADPRISDSSRVISSALASALLPLAPIKNVIPESYYPGAGDDAVSDIMTKNFLSLYFNGKNLKIYYLPSLRQTGLGRGKEKNISRFWDYLSQQEYYPVLFQLVQLKSDLGLNDYQYYQLVRQFAKKLFSKGKKGEDAAFTVFILNQTGFDAKIARLETEKSKETVVLLPLAEETSEIPFIRLGDRNYYLTDREISRKEKEVQVFTYTDSLDFAKHPVSFRFFPKECHLDPLYGKFQGYVFDERIAGLELQLPYPSLEIAAQAHFSPLLEKTLLFRFKPDIDSLIEKKQDSNLKHILTNREKQELAILQTAEFIQKNFSKNNKRGIKYSGILYPDQMFYKRGNGDILDKSLLLCKISNEILDIPAILLIFDNYAIPAVHLDSESAPSPESPFLTASYLELGGKRFFLCGRLPKDIRPDNGFRICQW